MYVWIMICVFERLSCLMLEAEQTCKCVHACAFVCAQQKCAGPGMASHRSQTTPVGGVRKEIKPHQVSTQPDIDLTGPFFC